MTNLPTPLSSLVLIFAPFPRLILQPYSSPHRRSSPRRHTGGYCCINCFFLHSFLLRPKFDAFSSTRSKSSLRSSHPFPPSSFISSSSSSRQVERRLSPQPSPPQQRRLIVESNVFVVTVPGAPLCPHLLLKAIRCRHQHPLLEDD